MAGRKTRLRLILVLLAISVSCRVLLAQPADAPPGEKLAYSVRDLTVQVVSSHGQNRDDNAAEGYGFVVAQQGDILTIATADHVVRDPDGAEFGEVWVVFYSDQGHPQPATVLDLRLPPADGDLAVLEVKKPGFRMAQSPVAALPLTQGERAWRVGKQRGWTPGNVPGVFTGTERTIWLAFDNLDTPRGSSGGPIVVEQGLVGMVTDIESGRALVLPINIIANFFHEKGLPWGFAPLSPNPKPVVSAPPISTSPPVGCQGVGTTLAPLASRAPRVLSTAEECALKPKDAFRECEGCPAMVVVPAGVFTMGSPASEPGRDDDEGPQHDVRIAKAFAIGEFPVTVDEFKVFVNATGYDAGSTCDAWRGIFWKSQSGRSWRDPGFAQTGSHPVVCVGWRDAQAYAKWLSGKTGKAYRLPSESEWEYADRGRTNPGAYPRYFFGDSDADFCKYGNGGDQTKQKQIPPEQLPKNWSALPCSSGYVYTSPVGSFRPNAFGLFDMNGNVWQWVEDCPHDNYNGAPQNGASWATANCVERVDRGGSWLFGRGFLQAAYRGIEFTAARHYDAGFRLARTLTH